MWQKIFMILLDINHIRGYINYNNCTNSYSTVVTERKTLQWKNRNERIRCLDVCCRRHVASAGI